MTRSFVFILCHVREAAEDWETDCGRQGCCVPKSSWLATKREI